MATRQTPGAGLVTFLEGMRQRGESPLTARSRFRHRHLRNWSKAVGIFAVVAIAFAVLLPPLAWYADILTGIVLWYLVFHVWDKQAVWLRCTHDKCQKLIETNVTWICGFKQCRNEAIDEFPFVHRCQHCGAEPKAYKCHHCGKPIFLTEDELEKNCARCTKPFKERSDLDVPGLQENLTKGGLELSIARVDKQLAGVNAGPDPDEDRERKRAAKLTKLDHKILLQKKKVELANEEAKAKFVAEANLPYAERMQRRYTRRREQLDSVNKGRALSKQRYPEGSLEYEQDMAIWDELKEQGSITG